MKRSEYRETVKSLLTELDDVRNKERHIVKQLENLSIVDIEEDNTWIPEYNQEYWIINISGVPQRSIWKNTAMDNCKLELGRVFRTEEDARFNIEKLRILNDLNQFSCKFKEGSYNYYLKVTAGDDKLSYVYDLYTEVQGVIYFESVESITRAISFVGEDLSLIHI